MTLRPGDLVGLPFPGDAASHAIALRYVLLLLALAGAALAARGRRALLVATAVLFVETALGFWTASLARPYGLFVDAGLTRAAAQASAARLPGEDGALSGEPRPASIPVRLVRRGVPAPFVTAGRSLVPLVVVAAIGAAVFLLAPRAHAAEAAVLWLAFSTSDAAALRGEGFLPGLWLHVGASVLLATAVAAALAAGRLQARSLAVSLAVVAALGLVLSTPAGTSPAPAQRVLAATFEQGPWLLLGAWGLARGAPPAAWGLVVAGGALYLLGPRAADTWATHAAYRLGLILAAAAPVAALCRAAASAVPERVCRAVAVTPERFGFALLLALTLPGAFVARWSPPALDPVFEASRSPLSTNLQPGLEWLQAHTPEDATCVASEDYAALVAVVGGRRVLRAPELWDPPDDQRRRRAERTMREGREPELLRRYQVGCLFFASSDVGWLGTTAREDLDRAPGLRLGYADAFTRVYTVTVPPSAP